MSVISSIPVLISATTALVALWSAAYLLGSFSSNVVWSCRVIDVDDERKIIRITIKNDGRIRVSTEKILVSVEAVHVPEDVTTNDVALLQNEWISFENADAIMTSTNFLNPKEEISVDRLYHTGGADLLHVGMQVYLGYPWFIQILGGQVRSSRQTKTQFLVSEDQKNE